LEIQETMIFIFADDRTFEVVNGLEEVRRDCEGIDVENGVFQFFDEKGSRLEPRFTKANKKGRLLGLLSWVESGEFDLIPSSKVDEHEIFLSLLEDSEMETNPWFKSVVDIKAYLESKAKRSGDEESS
jgi:hypothetical protein